MNLLALQPLSIDLLPAALALDRRCFGGLWTLDGYRRELESPNSELLVLMEEAGSRSQESGVKVSGSTSEAGVGSIRESEVRSQKSESIDRLSGGETKHDQQLKTNSQQPTTLLPQNSKLSSAAARSATQNSKLLTPLIGLGCYWAILEEAHITMLAIDPAYQHQGLGQVLLHALMASAHQRGLERATLEVRISNQAALALYKKFDFREAGRRRRYYPDNGEDALVLWRGGLQAPEFSDHLAVWQRQVDDRLHETGWQLTDERSSSV